MPDYSGLMFDIQAQGQRRGQQQPIPPEEAKSGYDERGEPIGEVPMDGPPQAQQQAVAEMPYPQRQMRPPPPGANTIQTPNGPMIVPSGGETVALTNESQAETDRYLADMAKAGQLDKAQKDVDQAMRFLGMRGVEKDVENGTPYAQALAKHLPFISWNNPAQAQAYSKIIAAAQPPAPLTMTNINGVQVLRTPRGDRIVPQSAIPQPPVTSAQTIPFTDPTTGEPVPGYFATPSAGGRGSTIHKRVDMEPAPTQTELRHQINDSIRSKNAQIDKLERPPKKDAEAFSEWKRKVDKLNADIDQLENQRPSPIKKHNVPEVKDRVVGQVYQTPSGPHKWTAHGWVLP